MDKKTASEILKNFKGIHLESGNEAATRLRVIDRVLKEVLLWNDEDIKPEEHVTEDGNTTYADYILKTANIALVVEAKKAGADFKSISGKRREKLSNTFLQSELGVAILQARDYARKFGIDYAVATNGNVWACFPAQRHDQIKFNESTALIFWSLNDCLNESYQEFYDLLSREHVISGSLETALLGRIENQVEDRKLRNFFTQQTKTPYKNPIYDLLSDEIRSSFSESIAELESESFDKCYVSTPESIRFDKKIRMNIGRRSGVINRQILKGLNEKDAKKITSKFEIRGKKDIRFNNSKPLAMLLLGTVGAGKTTFIHYMRKVRLKELFNNQNHVEKTHWVHINFLNNPPGNSAIDFIYNCLKEYIISNPELTSQEFVFDAYKKDIDAINSGPLFLLSEQERNKKVSNYLFDEYNKTKPYVEKIISHITIKEPFFLVIDNVDQIESDEIQSSIFTESFSIARSLSLNLILSLRQSTFLRHKSSPAIDAFDFETILIEPPRISSVIAKRFALVKYMVSGKHGEFIAENGAKIHLDDVSILVDILSGSVLGSEIGNRIEVMATDDVRLSLRMTREFLERGYTSPGKAVEIYRSQGRYLLPRHEAFRAIMLGTSTTYSESTSSIANPFDANLAVSQMQLLRFYILNVIVNYASDTAFRQVDGSILTENLRKIGVGDVFSLKVITDLCEKRYLFTVNHGSPSLNSSFIPSRLGGYIVKELVSNFTFLECMLYDTYISDTKIWRKIRELTSDIDSERDIVKRVKLRVFRVKIFYTYLRKIYRNFSSQATNRGLSSQWCSDPFHERYSEHRDELLKVIRSAKRNYPVVQIEENSQYYLDERV